MQIHKASVPVFGLDPAEWKVEDKTPLLVGFPGGFCYSH